MDEIKIIKVGVVYQLYLNREYSGTFANLMDAVKWVEGNVKSREIIKC